MAGYTRQSTFADGDTITAALFNNEYNQLLNAFSNTGGHKHDGTANEGPVIGLIGDAGVVTPLNKVLIDSTNDHIEFWIDVSSSSVQQLYIADGAIVPVTDSDVDLGTSSLYFKNAYIDSITTTGNVAVGGNLTVTGTTTFNGGTITMGDAATDNVVFGADVDSNIIPDDDDSYDLGSSSQEWRNLYIDGTANIDSLIADTADINGGTIDGTIIGGSSAAAITGTAITGTSFVIGSATITEAELEILDGATVTTDELNILDGVTSTAAEINILDGVTSTAAELNLLDGVTSTTAELNILDGVTASAADINLIDGITNGTVIASKAIITDANKDITGGRNITISGELDAGSLDVSGNVDVDGTLETDALSINGTTVTSTAAELNILDGKAFLDEDNMASNSATGIASQQSIKAYVDTQITAEDLDITTDSGTIAIDLDSETLTVSGGTGLDSSATGNAVTLAIDSTVATLTGSQTLTNKTLTSPDVNTPDIDGGTVDGSVIGGATPAAGTFTTLTANTSIAGTLSTAAQTNITSVGTLSALTVDDITINGSTISDAGDLTLDVGGDITLDADGGVVYLNDGGVGFGQLVKNSNDFRIFNPISDGDIVFRGNDNGSVISALTLDMSDAGTAIFNNNLVIPESIYHTGDTNTFFGFPSADTFTVNTSGSERMRINSSGNVGIGTASPASTISGSAAVLHLYDGTNNNLASLALQAGTVGSKWEIGALSSNALGFFDDGSERVRIDTSGNVGIGTTSPAAPLHVNGEAYFNAGTRHYTYDDQANFWSLYTNTDDSFRFNYNGAGGDEIVIDTSGNVGIGTDSPQQKLTVGDGADSEVISIFAGSGAASGIHFTDTNTSGDDFQGFVTYDHSADALRLGTAEAERMRINSSGNVGIGTSSPTDKLHLGTNSGGTQLKIQSASSSNNCILHTNGTTDSWRTGMNLALTNGSYEFYDDVNNVSRMVIDSSGNVGIGETSPDKLLHLKSSGATGIAIESTTNAQDLDIDFYNNAGSAQGRIRYSEGAGSFNFAPNVSASDALIIDYSGNVLVGNTDTTPYDRTSGNAIALGDGLISSAQEGGNAAIFNRMTSDGSIVGFRKDGTTVGSIGSRAGLVTNIILDPRADGSGLTGTTNTIEPIDETGTRVDGQINWGSSAYRFKDLYLSGGTIVAGRTTFGTAGFWDASATGNNKGLRVGGAGLYPTDGNGTPLNSTLDIGTAAARFKDLYLSGGAYLGGTAAANHLDDYEEGTWTPTSGVGLSILTTCHYLKIGKHLTVTFDITFASNSNGSSVSLNSLPFSYTSYNSGFNGWNNTGSVAVWHIAGSSAALYNGESNAVLTYAAVSGKRLIGTITGILT